MHRTLVTAVIPVYAREDVFGTLEALGGFPRAGAELRAIVVDNGNGEALSERLAGLPRRHGWCTVVRLRENRGGAGAFRAGMAAALRRGGDFVWLLDDDALVNAGTLSGLLAEYARLEGEGVRVGAVGSTLLGRREPTRVTEVGASVSLFSGALRLRHHGAEIHSLGDCTDEVEYVAAASLLVRAAILREVGPFEDVFIHYDDIEWCFRLRRKGYRLFVTTRSTVNHAEWEGKFAPWVLYYDARNLLWFLRQYKPFAGVVARMKLGLQRMFLRMHGAAAAANLLALGVRHARTGELLLRGALPEIPRERYPLERVLAPGQEVVVLAHTPEAAALWERLADARGARCHALVFEGLVGRGLAGRVWALVCAGARHLWAQAFLCVHPAAALLFDVAGTKGYPFPFWCRRRALFQANGEALSVFAYSTVKPVKPCGA